MEQILSRGIVTSVAICLMATVAVNAQGPIAVSDLPPDTVEHPAEGPHHGALIELGEEEYHGEIVHDPKAGTVTIYVLDGSATKTAPIPARGAISVEVAHGDQLETFPFWPVAQDGEPLGRASKFVSKDKHLGGDIDDKALKPILVANILGKTYRGLIGHHHHLAGHHSVGPHQGDLIELGDEEYHGELVHDEEKHVVVIYILDGKAKSHVPIPARQVAIYVKHGSENEQFVLAASPDENDPAGKSSRFISTDRHLSDDLDAKGTDAHLVVTIGGKKYDGHIHHHAGHSHDHEHDHDHDHKLDHKH